MCNLVVWELSFLLFFNFIVLFYYFFQNCINGIFGIGLLLWSALLIVSETVNGMTRACKIVVIKFDRTNYFHWIPLFIITLVFKLSSLVLFICIPSGLLNAYNLLKWLFQRLGWFREDFRNVGIGTKKISWVVNISNVLLISAISPTTIIVYNSSLPYVLSSS